MAFSASEENLDRASTLLKAMGNRRRLHILCLLSAKERRVGELEQLVGLSQSALSQHLARLRRDGVVKTRRQAQTIYYSLASDDVRVILGLLDQIGGTGGADAPPVIEPRRTAMAR